MFTIHARRKEDGKTVYRIWSDDDECHVTGEISKERVKPLLLTLKLKRIEAQHLAFVDEELERAERTGTSLSCGVPCDLNGPWPVH